MPCRQSCESLSYPPKKHTCRSSRWGPQRMQARKVNRNHNRTIDTTHQTHELALVCTHIVFKCRLLKTSVTHDLHASWIKFNNKVWVSSQLSGIPSYHHIKRNTYFADLSRESNWLHIVWLFSAHIHVILGMCWEQGYFCPSFYKGKQHCEFLFASLNEQPLSNGVSS